MQCLQKHCKSETDFTFVHFIAIIDVQNSVRIEWHFESHCIQLTSDVLTKCHVS